MGGGGRGGKRVKPNQIAGTVSPKVRWRTIKMAMPRGASVTRTADMERLAVESKIGSRWEEWRV